jgi:hypothetical protein
MGGVDKDTSKPARAPFVPRRAAAASASAVLLDGLSWEPCQAALAVASPPPFLSHAQHLLLFFQILMFHPEIKGGAVAPAASGEAMGTSMDTGEPPAPGPSGKARVVGGRRPSMSNPAPVVEPTGVNPFEPSSALAAQAMAAHRANADAKPKPEGRSGHKYASPDGWQVSVGPPNAARDVLSSSSRPPSS